MAKKVVVNGGGNNLYKIGIADGWHYVSQVDVGFISNSYNSIGKTRSLSDAVDLIRAHSGRSIKFISEW